MMSQAVAGILSSSVIYYPLKVGTVHKYVILATLLFLTLNRRLGIGKIESAAALDQIKLSRSLYELLLALLYFSTITQGIAVLQYCIAMQICVLVLYCLKILKQCSIHFS